MRGFWEYHVDSIEALNHATCNASPDVKTAKQRLLLKHSSINNRRPFFSGMTCKNLSRTEVFAARRNMLLYKRTYEQGNCILRQCHVGRHILIARRVVLFLARVSTALLVASPEAG